MSSIRAILTDAFDAWSRNERHVSELFDVDLTWHVMGESKAAGRYVGARQFVDEVLAPFARRFREDDPFRPVRVEGLYIDGDTAVVLWEGEGTTVADTVYRNDYAWVLTFADGLIVHGVAFYDSITFNRLWAIPDPGVSGRARQQARPA